MSVNIPSPSTQNALTLSSTGQPYTVSTRPVPIPGPGQVLIKIHAAALNPIDDSIQRVGVVMKEWPAVAGSDGAGEVVTVGEGGIEGSMTVGDRV